MAALSTVRLGKVIFFCPNPPNHQHFKHMILNHGTIETTSGKKKIFSNTTSSAASDRDGQMRGATAGEDLLQAGEKSSQSEKQDLSLASVRDPGPSAKVFSKVDASEPFFKKPVQGLGGRVTPRNLVLLVLLAIPVIAAYANTLSVPFYFDDYFALVQSPKVRLTEITWDFLTRFDLSQRPVAYLTFALNYYFHQYDLPGYHLVNICVHLLSGFFLFFLVRETARLADPHKDESSVMAVAFWATLIWSVNPLLTSSVTYVVQRMTSLAAMFYVLALYIYVRGRLLVGFKRWCCYGLTLLVWLLALGSKQIAIPLPFFIILYEVFFFQKFDRAWLGRNLKYFLGALALFVVLAALFLGTAPLDAYWAAYARSGLEFTPPQRFFTEFRVVVRYLSLLFFPYPDRLVFDYNYPLSNGFFDPITTIFSMATVSGLLAVSFYTARKQPLFSFAIFWYFGNLLLEVVWPTSIIFEHKAYLPTMFLFVPLCDWLVQVVKWKRFSAAALIVMGLFCFWTYQRNVLWQDPVALWQHTVYKSPGKARSYSNLGVALGKQNRNEEAIPYFKEALRLKHEYPGAMNNLGVCLLKQGKYREAIVLFEKSLHYRRNYFDAHANLGTAYRDAREMEKAIFHLRKAVSIDPGNAAVNAQLQSTIYYAEEIEKGAERAKR